MRVSIVTVYNSNNPGSYWQGRALYETVCELLPGGAEKNQVVFYDAGTRKFRKKYLLTVLKNALAFKFHKAGFIYRNHNSIVKDWASLPHTNDGRFVNGSDVVLFGSDEIWNFERKEIRDYPVLAGGGINGPRKASVALSAGNTGAETMKKFGLPEYLKDFNYLSVRDQETRDAVAECTDLPIDIICDPTLARNGDFFPDVKRPLKGKYIALYGLDVPKEYISLVKEISKEMNLPLVSLARWYNFCDDCVADESVFAYYRDAAAVISMTFHGTAFAINFEKPFVVLSCGRKKIKRLIEETGLTDRCIDGMSAKGAAEILRKDIDFTKARQVLEEKRGKFREALKKALFPEQKND